MGSLMSPNTCMHVCIRLLASLSITNHVAILQNDCANYIITFNLLKIFFDLMCDTTYGVCVNVCVRERQRAGEHCFHLF